MQLQIAIGLKWMGPGDTLKYAVVYNVSVDAMLSSTFHKGTPLASCCHCLQSLIYPSHPNFFSLKDFNNIYWLYQPLQGAQPVLLQA